MTQDTQILGMIGDMKGELGEVRGQLRELIHTTNNLAQKFDAAGQVLAKHHDVPSDIADLKARVAVLEAIENQRKGATSLGMLILKSPAIGWLVGAAAAVYAYLKG